MVELKVMKVGDELAVVLTEELRQSLGVADGGTLYAAPNAAGQVTLASRDMSHDARRARGREFMARYSQTLETLAK